VSLIRVNPQRLDRARRSLARHSPAAAGRRLVHPPFGLYSRPFVFIRGSLASLREISFMSIRGSYSCPFAVVVLTFASLREIFLVALLYAILRISL
jgi:hypothetical protein